MQNESDAIKNLIPYLNSDFEDAVKHLLDLEGRIIVTGIGKSAIIAQKIVATLNSTGSPAIFMQAADALHGDLGIIQPGDSVLCISKSGNTAEIKVLIPHIKELKAKIIGMASRKDSYLAKNSDFFIYSPVGEEADPNNLAPTTSTTVQLAMGDAIAVCLLTLKEFSPEDFSKYHPGGALGKKLYLKVDELLHLHELPLVNLDSSFNEVIVEIASKRLGACAVIEQDGKLAGIITDGDLRRTLEKHAEHSFNLLAHEIMSTNPHVIPLGTFATEALQILTNNEITQLIILEESGKPKAFIHMQDILNEGIDP